jgi:gluconate 2-dehydrogenase gamma chain
MDRREALRRAAILMGGAISAPTIMGILKGCKAEPSINWKPTYFTEEQAGVITTLSDIILPATDTPGAKETGVPSFIERMIHEAYSPTDRDAFMNGLAEFMKDAETNLSDRFIDADADQQEKYVLEVHKSAIESKEAGQPFILKMKELTMLGFFTSEVGATKVLQYEQVPGHYFGCKPLNEIGKTWA